METRMLKLLKLEDHYYLKLADVERLVADMRREILNNATAELNDDGTKNYMLTDAERERLEDLYFISHCIRYQLSIQCETPEEERELHEKIRKMYYWGKYYLSETQRDDNGKPTGILYFRKYCLGAMKARMEAEGKSEGEIKKAMETEDGDPVFTPESKQARLFESLESAEANMTYLNHNYKMDLTVSPAIFLDHGSCKEFLDKLLKGDETEDDDEDAFN